MASITPRYLEIWKRKFETPEEIHALEYTELPITGNEANPTYTVQLDTYPEVANILPRNIMVILVDKNDTESGEFDDSKRSTFIQIEGDEEKCYRFSGLLDQDTARAWTRYKYKFQKYEDTVDLGKAMLAEKIAASRAKNADATDGEGTDLTGPEQTDNS